MTPRVVAPAALALFAAAGLALTDRPLVPAALAAGLVALTGVVLGTARSTGWPLLVGSLVAVGGTTYLGSGQPGNLGWFALCVLAGWVATVAGRGPTAVLVGVAVVDVVVQGFSSGADAGWLAWAAGTVFSAVACLLAAQQRVLLEQLHAAQAGLADRARSEERTRIAREMHDVVGHALGVTLLHLGSARLALDDEPDRARAALEEAERNARRSLEEVRASVGLLREEGQGPETRPLPGGADLAALVDGYRRTGAPVSCEVSGDVSALPATTGLAAYRIVQEALTNVARHAPGAATAVRLRVGARTAELSVESAGAPGPTGAGTGLVGMRERAEALGGTATAGPAGTGWRVEAVLPL